MKPNLQAQKTSVQYRQQKDLLCNTRLWLGKGSGIVQAHGLRMRGHLGWAFYGPFRILVTGFLFRNFNLSYHTRDLQ